MTGNLKAGLRFLVSAQSGQGLPVLFRAGTLHEIVLGCLLAEAGMKKEG
jgi:hypothetical protein